MGMSPLTNLYTHDIVPITYGEVGAFDLPSAASAEPRRRRWCLSGISGGIGAMKPIARESVDDMAHDTALFIDALGLSAVHLLG